MGWGKEGGDGKLMGQVYNPTPLCSTHKPTKYTSKSKSRVCVVSYGAHQWSYLRFFLPFVFLVVKMKKGGSSCHRRRLSPLPSPLVVRNPRRRLC